MYYVVTQDFKKDNIITPDLMTPHVEYIKNLIDYGVVVVSGPFSDNRRGGMYILDVKNENEAKELAERDPAVKSGILKNDIRLYDLKFFKNRKN